MTDREKALIVETNQVMISQAREYMSVFHAAIMIACKEQDDARLRWLAEKAEKFRDWLSEYVDLCEEAQNAEVLQLLEYFAGNAADIRKALDPTKGSEGDEWKQE